MLRKRLFLALGVVSFFLVYLTGWFASLTDPQRALAATMALVVCWWISEAFPLWLTGLLGTALAYVLGVSDLAPAFKGYVHPLIFLFLGAFLIARALQVQELDREIARVVLGNRWVRGSPIRLLAAIGVMAGALSAFISNTAATAVAVPIVAGLLPASGGDDPDVAQAQRRFQTGALLMLAFAATLGGLTTPVGTPPNAIGIGLVAERAKTTLSFFEWTRLAGPVALGVAAFVLPLLWFLYGRGPVPLQRIAELKRTKGDRAARMAVSICFGACVLLWLLPDLLRLVHGGAAAFTKRFLPTFVPPLAASAALFLWPKKKLLRPHDLRHIDWGTLVLFGSGLCLGSLMFATGLADRIGHGLSGLLGTNTLWGITGLAIAIAILLSEASSNTASANIAIPLVIGIAEAAKVPLLPPALGAALGASFGFMMPVSTPPNAIVYGTGKVPLPDMMKAGILLDCAAFLIIWAGLRILCPLLGLV